MGNTYHYNLKATLSSLKYLKRNFLMLPFLMMLSIPIAHFLKGYSIEESITIGPAVNIMAFLCLGCFPTLIIHLTHYNKSRNLEISFSHDGQHLIINNAHEYSIGSLHCTEHLAYSKKKLEDGKFRFLTPWSNYSFIVIDTDDNKQFKISSIIAKSENLPFAIQERKYTYWPVIS